MSVSILNQIGATCGKIVSDISVKEPVGFVLMFGNTGTLNIFVN